MIENRKFLSFSGVIGRKWYFLRWLLALLVPILALMPALSCYYFSGLGAVTDTLSKEGLNNIVTTLGLLIIVPLMILNFLALIFFFLILIGLQVRRGRDMFRQTQAHPIVETILVILFWATKAFLGVGGLALFVVPGGLAQGAKGDPPSA